MRGPDAKTSSLFSYVSLEGRVPRDHPLRDHRQFLDGILRELSPRDDVKAARPRRHDHGARREAAIRGCGMNVEIDSHGQVASGAGRSRPGKPRSLAGVACPYRTAICRGMR